MSILLTHGYFLSDDAAEKRIMKPYPPLGLLYISAFLDSKNIPHTVLDSTFMNEAEWLDYVRENDFELIGFYCNFLTKPTIIKLIHKLRSSKKCAPIKFVVGGPDVPYNIEAYLSHGADFAVFGEGEETFTEFAEQFYNESAFHKVDGLAYLNADNEPVINKLRAFISDFDRLPFPNRSKIDIQKYLDVWKTAHGKSSLNISTQRGCPYTCQWCSKAVYGQSYRRRSPENVVDEAELLIKQYKPDSLWFVDDVFTISAKWIERFSEEMRRRNIKIPFECITRAEKLNETILTQLKAAGCFRIWIGAESGSQKIIDLMHRQVNIQTVIEMMHMTKKHGIETGTFIMIGYPGETKKDIALTTKYLKAANPDLFTITKTYPIKGTDLYKQIENDIIYQPEWHLGSDRQIRFKRAYSDKYYDYLIRKITNEVNFHKLKLKGRQFTANAAVYKAKSVILSVLIRFMN